MRITLNLSGLPEAKALLRTQIKIAEINLIDALNQTAEQVVAILKDATPGGPDGPVASQWDYFPAENVEGTIRVIIFNPATTEDGKYKIAELLEYGTPPHLILPKNKKALAFPAGKTSHSWEGPRTSPVRSNFGDFERRNFSPVTGGYRPSHASSARYGNTVLSRGEYHRAIASDVKTGKAQFRSAKTGKLSRPNGATDMVIVKEVHHPGTPPRFIVRSRLGTFQAILLQNSTIALRVVSARADIRRV